MLIEFLEQIFARTPASRGQAKQRLKFILAHDRADLTPAALESMRLEILEVVARYVELDPEGLQFNLTSEQGTTALIANLPIRRVRTSPNDTDPSLDTGVLDLSDPIPNPVDSSPAAPSPEPALSEPSLESQQPVADPSQDSASESPNGHEVG